MNLLKLFFGIVFIVMMSFNVNAKPKNTPAERYVMRQEKLDSLKFAKNYNDSIRMLYDAYDLSTRSQHGVVGKLVLKVAQDAKDYSAVNDIVIELANRFSSNDSILVYLLKQASRLPHSEMKKQTIAYLCMVRNNLLARTSSEATRQNILHSTILKIANDPPVEIYDKLVVTHTVCAFLATSFRGELVNKYFNEFVDIADQLPSSCHALRNFVYSQASDLFVRSENYEKAIVYNFKYLNHLDSMETEYHRNGREYSDYSYNRYLIYSALLQCFSELEKASVDEYYKNALSYAAVDSDAILHFQNYETPTLFYLMAKERYGEAIPVIKRQINKPHNSPRRRTYLRFLIEASKAINDNPTLLDASVEYNTILEDFIKSRDYEKYKELQVMYDVYDLKSDKYKLELEKQDNAMSQQKRTIMFSVISIIVMLVFLFILYRLYINARRLSKDLKESNSMLQREKENLQKAQKEVIVARDEALNASKMKSDFITNISSGIKVPLHAINEYSKLIVDCAEGEKKSYLEKFAGLIDFNGELLNTIVNDMLHLSELENSTMTLSYSGVNVNHVCNLAVDTVVSRVKPGVKIYFHREADVNPVVSTDRRRVEQVLVNLLSNASKFTSDGSIVLSYTVDKASDRLVFSVTDTGCGIPDDKKELIFERFVKLDKNIPGAGLGLTISRMMARLLGGDVWLDTSYKRGARFMFSIPL